MVRRVQVVLEDDIYGGDAERTVEFSLDGNRYEIDLNADNIARLEQSLAPFVEHARALGSRAGRRAGVRKPGARNHTTAVREWARAQGMEVSERGRISHAVLEAYNRAH